MSEVGPLPAWLVLGLKVWMWVMKDGDCCHWDYPPAWLSIACAISAHTLGALYRHARPDTDR